MDTVFKYAIISQLVLQMLLMILVAIFSAFLVLATIPKRNRD
ncbi:MAG: hypothetical protein ACFCAD_13630 [Pleurocapsa sp.]